MNSKLKFFATLFVFRAIFGFNCSDYLLSIGIPVGIIDTVLSVISLGCSYIFYRVLIKEPTIITPNKCHCSGVSTIQEKVVCAECIHAQSENSVHVSDPTCSFKLVSPLNYTKDGNK